MSAESLLCRERHALRRTIEEAVIADELGAARSALATLHWYGHDDPSDHAFVHAVELDLARRAGDARGMVGSFLPFVFGATVARFEKLGFTATEEAFLAAEPERVYDVVADVARYAEWNPWLLHAEGRPEVGAAIEADVRLGARTIRASHRVLVAERGVRFAWCDTGWFTPLARGRRFRSFFREAGGTRLVTRLVVVGPLASLAVALHGEGMRQGLRDEMSALKRRVECAAEG